MHGENSGEISLELRAELLALAVGIGEEAAGLLRTRREQGVRVASTKSTELDIVTDTDREVELFIRSRLVAVRPMDGFIGEEGESEIGTSGVTWVVDPLDGTVNYLYGVGPYAVSIAAVSGSTSPATWNSEVGVVVICPERITYAAAFGGGATANGESIYASSEERLSHTLVSTGFGYDRATRKTQSALVDLLSQQVRDVRMSGSAAADLCYVASGRLDAYIEQHLHAWDYAAGVLIVSEAGGVVGGAHGPRADDDLVIASAKHVFSAIKTLTYELGPGWAYAVKSNSFG